MQMDLRVSPFPLKFTAQGRKLYKTVGIIIELRRLYPQTCRRHRKAPPRL